MKIEKEVINKITCISNLNKESISIKYSIIDILDFEMDEFNNEVLIENCIIKNLLIHSSWFKKGLIFKNNQVLNYVDYQMGGHNKKPIILESNIFIGFVNFLIVNLMLY